MPPEPAATVTRIAREPQAVVPSAAKLSTPTVASTPTPGVLHDTESLRFGTDHDPIPASPGSAIAGLVFVMLVVLALSSPIVLALIVGFLVLVVGVGRTFAAFCSVRILKG